MHHTFNTGKLDGWMYDPLKVIQLIQKRPWMFKLDGQDKLRFEIKLPAVEEREEWVVNLIGEIN